MLGPYAEGAVPENSPPVRFRAPVALVAVGSPDRSLKPGAAERGGEAEVSLPSPRRVGERSLERVPGRYSRRGERHRAESGSRRQPRLSQTHLTLPDSSQGNVCAQKEGAELLAAPNIEGEQVRDNSQRLVGILCPQGLPLPPESHF